MATVFSACGAPIVLADEHKRILAVNPAYTELTGYTAAESVGQPLHLLPPSDAGAAMDAEVDASLAREGRWRGEVLQPHRDGSTSPAWMCLDLAGDGTSHARRYVATFADISLLRRGDARLRHLAHHDPLTDLPNRLLFESELARCVARAQRHSQQFAMLFLDIDHFKDVNDTFGHATGDRVLREVGQRLRQTVRAGDIVARLGGDEFTVVLEDLAHAAEAARMAGKILAALEVPIPLGGQALKVTASIGVALFPADAADAESLTLAADTAMYRAKQSGRHAFVVSAHG